MNVELKTAVEKTAPPPSPKPEPVKPPSKTPVSDTVIAIRNRKDDEPRITPPVCLAGQRPVVDEKRFYWYAVEQGVEKPLVTESETAEIVSIWESAKKVITAHEPFAIARTTDRHQSLKDNHRAVIVAGGDPGALPTRDELFKDGLHRHTIFLEQLETLWQRLAPILRTVVGRFEIFIDAQLRQTEETEREMSRIVGLEWIPSALFRALADAARRYTVKGVPEHWQPPEAVIGPLVPHIFGTDTKHFFGA